MKINNLIRSILFLSVIVFTASCAESVKITSDYSNSTDFSKYKTFSVYELVTTPNVNQFNAERIVNAIRSEMIKKGFRENNTNPDMVVSAVTVLKNKQTITASGTGGGWYRPYRDVSVRSNNYKEGTLIIDIWDVKEENLIWEGTAYSEIEKKPKNPEKMINSVVTKILSGFPSTDKNKTDHASM
jgi:hypothetical protein